MSEATSAISASPSPAVVSAADPNLRPLATKGGRGSFGMALPVAGDPGPVKHVLGHLAGELLLERSQVDEHEVVVGPARDEAKALNRQRLGQSRRVAHDLGGVLAELRLEGLAEGDRLGRDHVLERSALQPGEDSRVDRLGQVGTAENGTAPRAAEGLWVVKVTTSATPTGLGAPCRR